MTEGHEQRKQRREQTIFYLEAVDVETDQEIGRVVDMTPDGLMIINKDPLAINRIYHLKIKLPKELAGDTELYFKAECRWCRQSINDQFFDAGLRITDISADDKLRIDMVLKFYTFPSDI
ncbi:MAG: PilZ domain-containing protein [Desulfuromonadaceae bacterium]|jgi:hypothetical protein